MIEVTISGKDATLLGREGVVRRLRQRGIPVRLQFGENLRLCKVWDNNCCIGDGRLEWERHNFSGDTVFRYWPPAGSNVVDVEAREVVDVPRLK